MNSAPTVVTKLAVLVPLALAVFYFDLPGAYQALLSQGGVSIVVASLLVSVFGLGLKRRIIRESLDISRPSFAWGTLLLLGFVSTYLLGSYSAYGGALHYDALLLLVLSYVAYRIGTQVLRAVVPLLPILLLASPVASLGASTALPLFVLGSGLLFLWFARANAVSVLLPLAFLLLGVGARFNPTLLSVPTWVFVPLPLLALSIRGVRRELSLPHVMLPSSCQGHQVLSMGFCSVCGRKVSKSSTPDRFAPWGLVATAAVIAVLVLASVPALAVGSRGAFDAVYSSRGVSGPSLPGTPAGWQLNSTAVFQYGPTEPYAVEKVYVPLYHPEVKNYTVYCEVYSGLLIGGGPGGGEIPGWGRVSNNFTHIGPLEGYLTVYESGGTLLLAYQGNTQMTFASNGGFQGYTVTMGFTRQFKNTNIAADSSEFLSDITTYWLPVASSDASRSSLTSSLATIYAGAESSSPLVLLVASSLAIAWVAYRARSSDSDLDDFLRRCSRLGGREWSSFGRLLAVPGLAGTGYELLGAASGVEERISELRQLRIIRPKPVEKGDQLLLLWKAAF